MGTKPPTQPDLTFHQVATGLATCLKAQRSELKGKQMSNASPETPRLMQVYLQTLSSEGIITSFDFLGVMLSCIGSPGSKSRAAFTAMLESLDADYTKWSTNETYREAMMKD